MSLLVSTIYYSYLNECIEIYWDYSNIFVHNSGIWIPLPDMTIQNVIHLLGFKNNKILSSLDVLHMNVSSAPPSIITILNETKVREHDIYDNKIKSKGCIQNIMEKIETFILN